MMRIRIQEYNCEEEDNMQKFLYNRKFWIAVITLFVGIISIFLYENLSLFISKWFDTLKITIGIVGLVTTLFNHWKKFNLFITRIWIILTNSSSIWNVSSNFEGNFNESDFKAVIKKLRQEEMVTDYFEISATVIRLSVNGLNYMVEYTDIESSDGTDTKGKLYCKIIDFNSSYDHSIKIMEEEIIPCLRIIENQCQADEKTFTFKISFDGKNPFIKLITKNINEKSIDDLWYSTHEKTKVGRRDVKITKQSIECTTSDITDFQKSSLNYITLVGG